MRAVLLAAGEGKRLRPATLSRPKPFLPLAGTTLFNHNLRCLNELGVRDPVVVINYMKERVSQLLDSIGIRWVDQGEPKGTGHALMVAREWVRGKFVVSYSDVYLPCKVFREAASVNSDYVVVAARVETPWEFGVIKLEDGKFKGIVEKPPRGEEPSNLVVAGLFVFNDSIFDYLELLKPSPRGEYELTEAITTAAEKDIAVVISDEWLDAGRPRDFLKAQRILFNGSRVHETSRVINSKIIPPVIVGPNSEVRDSTIGPFVYLEGENRVSNATVSDSVLMRGSEVLESDVSWAILADGSRVLKSKAVPGPEGFSLVTAPEVVIIGCLLSSERAWSSKRCTSS